MTSETMALDRETADAACRALTEIDDTFPARYCYVVDGEGDHVAIHTRGPVARVRKYLETVGAGLEAEEVQDENPAEEIDE